MIALCFEVTPRPGNEGRYLDIAASLRPELEQSGGVTFLERYRSLSRPGTMLSHQIWKDEAALARWRANGRHHAAQTGGRHAVFADYRLRVGAVVAWRDETAAISERSPGISYNADVAVAERYAVVVRSKDRAFSHGQDGEGWRSVYADTSFAWVGAVGSRAAGLALLALAANEPCVSAAQLCLISRDYGMFDRREAPQYFPPVTTA